MNFEEKIIERLKRIEREVERLRVWERPDDNHIVTVLAISPPQTYYYKIATLPAATPSTYDHLVIEGVGSGFAASQKAYFTITFGNRAGFNADTSFNSNKTPDFLFGIVPIRAYQENDGSISIYAVAIANLYGLLTVRLVDQIQATIYKNPVGVTTAPTGTKVYDLAEV